MRHIIERLEKFIAETPDLDSSDTNKLWSIVTELHEFEKACAHECRELRQCVNDLRGHIAKANSAYDQKCQEADNLRELLDARS